MSTSLRILLLDFTLRPKSLTTGGQTVTTGDFRRTLFTSVAPVVKSLLVATHG
jgi:hypothetical protein